MAYTQDNLYCSVSSPLGKDKLLFQELHGEEKLSGLFHFHLKMLSEDKALNFDSIVGKNLCVTMKFAKHQRYLNGVVTRFVQAGGDPRFTQYYAELRPWLWELGLSRNCKIFQNMTVPEIIKKIFSDGGYTDFKESLSGTYSQREYCVQYEESDLAFVSRLMEDEGIYYYFEHSDSAHTLVLADDADAHQDCPGISTARYWLAENTTQPVDVITSCTWSQQVSTGKYAVDDFNFEIPSTDLKVQVDGVTGKQRVYEYAPNYKKTAEGKTLATKRIESLEWNNNLLQGQSYCLSFIAGYKFTMDKHPNKTLNQKYLLHSVSHSISLTQYSNSFVAFPATVTFRSPLTTPKPRIHGSQTAIVTGKSGEEIWTDKYGRIKVQFHWDQDGKKDENSSCWIRVNQGWAGKQWGSWWLPRVNQEVIVSFLNGDPDRPLVTGAVYNAEQTVPYTLPSDQTKSTIKSHSTKKATGFNELRFEDKKDNEEFYMHAQKDMNIEVLNDQTSTIKNNRSVTIEEKDDTLTISKGSRTATINQSRTTKIQEQDDTLTIEKGSRKETIKQDHSVTIQEGNRSIKVAKGGENHTVKKDYVLKVDGNLTIDVKGDITIKSGKSISVKASKSITHNAGSSLTNQAKQALTNKAGTNLTNDAKMALTNKAGMSLTNKADMSLTNEAKVNMKHKAAIQTLEATGITTVKGILVKIN